MILLNRKLMRKLSEVIMIVEKLQGFREDKFCTEVDETQHYQHIVAELKQELSKAGLYTPGNPDDEFMIIRAADIELSLIFIMRDTAYYDGTFHYFDQAWIAKKLKMFRSDLNATDEEVRRALNGNVQRSRLIAYKFPDRLDFKYKYSAFYTQHKQLSIIMPPKPDCEEVNPFSSAEYVDIMKKLKNS
jgi:hypothetical protein